jgi:hypothetical protein
MEPIRCGSSLLMTKLLTFRNPQGPRNIWVHIGKLLCTEICLVLLALTSTVETVALICLVLISRILTPNDLSPFQMLQSSCFTIIWSLANAIVLNPTCWHLEPKEINARYWSNHLSFTRGFFYRQVDRDYLHRAPPVYNQILLYAIPFATLEVSEDRARDLIALEYAQHP